jgi:hypothetical protein
LRRALDPVFKVSTRIELLANNMPVKDLEKSGSSGFKDGFENGFKSSRIVRLKDSFKV